MAAPKLVSASTSSDSFTLSSPIVLTFDTPIAAGEGAIRFAAFGSFLFDDDVNASKYITISGNTLTIDPPQDLAYGSRYQVY